MPLVLPSVQVSAAATAPRRVAARGQTRAVGARLTERAAGAVVTPTTDRAVAVGADPSAGGPVGTVGPELVSDRPARPAPEPATPSVAVPRPTVGIVVTGLAGRGRTSLVADLLGPAADGVCDPGPSYRVFRAASGTQVRAYLPGRRSPQRLSAAPVRPPRRVEIGCPAALLADLDLVDAPRTTGFDAAYTEIVLDAAQQAGALLLVTSAATPLEPAELALLVAAAGRVPTVLLAVTGTDRYPIGPDALAIRLDALAAVDPTLAGLRCLPAGPADVPALRRELVAWARGRRADAVADDPGHSGRALVGPDTTGNWRERLDARMLALRSRHAEALAADLSALHDRCLAPLAAPDPAASADLLDRELHAVSVRTSRELARTAETELRAVLTDVLGHDPAPAVLRRAAGAVAETVEGGGQVLMVTTTSAVAVLAGPGAVTSLYAYSVRDGAGPVLAPVGVALTDSCHLAWRRRCEKDGTLAREWLHRAVQAVGVELHRHVEQRLDDLHQGVTTVLSEAVDHGVLLA